MRKDLQALLAQLATDLEATAKPTGSDMPDVRAMAADMLPVVRTLQTKLAAYQKTYSVTRKARDSACVCRFKGAYTVSR